MKPLPAEDKCVGVYLLELVKQGEMFNVTNMSWLPIKAYHKFCGYNICSSFFCSKRLYDIVLGAKENRCIYRLGHWIYISKVNLVYAQSKLPRQTTKRRRF